MQDGQPYSELIDYYNALDYKGANKALVKELARILVEHRLDFIHLLTESGVKADASMTDEKLTELFFENIPTNKRLSLGASLLISVKNQEPSADGEVHPDNDTVKAAYRLLREEYSSAFDLMGGMANPVLKIREDKRQELIEEQERKRGAESEMKYEIQKQKQNKITEQMQSDAKKKELEQQKKLQWIVGLSALAALVLVGRRFI